MLLPKGIRDQSQLWGHESLVLQKIPSKKELLGQNLEKDLFERKAWLPRGVCAQGKVSVGAAIHIFSLVVSKPTGTPAELNQRRCRMNDRVSASAIKRVKVKLEKPCGTFQSPV